MNYNFKECQALNQTGGESEDDDEDENDDEMYDVPDFYEEAHMASVRRRSSAYRGSIAVTQKK